LFRTDKPINLHIFVAWIEQMDRLTAMRVFVEVAQRRSFTAAAGSLDMSRAMATRYVTELEQWLNARLLQRSTRRISLTEAGEACLLQCRQMLELSSEMKDVSGQDIREPKGQLRITTSISFGMAHLAAAIVDYQKQYPQVSVDMMMGERSVNLIEERIDLAIRISGELDPNLVARRIAACRSVVCASPDYLRSHGVPASPDELTEHNCLTYSNFGKGQWRFVREGKEIDVPVSGKLSANETTVLTQAALAGAGLALQPTYLAGPLIKSGQLHAVLTDWEPPELGIWGVYVSRRHLPATLRTLLDFLVQRYAGVPDWDRD
jgi:DNA-binding transcriptional LysR family regulator